MELVTKKSETIPVKRYLDDSSDCNLGEFKRVRTCLQVSRDFPPGCGITEAERRVFKNSRNSDSNLGKMTDFHGKDKLVGSKPFVKDKGDSFKPKELVRNKPPFGSRPPGKVKFWDPISSKEGHPQKPKVTTTITWSKPLKNSGNADSNLGKISEAKLGRNSSFLGAQKQLVTFKNFDNVESNLTRKERVKREKIKDAMIMFDEFNEKLYQENKLKPKGKKIADWRVPLEAAKIVKRRLKLMDPEKKLGPVCGVEIGNKFKYRAQLKLIGLHCQIHSGIDYIKIGEKIVAISIVDSHRYSNVSRFSDKLIYCGQGGFGFMRPKLQLEDQKLVRGNLALRNSMDEKTPVRVIRKVQGAGKSEVYVYDGLYIVEDYRERSEEGKTVFKFLLQRVPGQPKLLRMIRASR